EHTHEPPRDPSRTEVPGDVRERTVAPAPSRPLATTRPDRGTVERLRRMRSRVRESTARDAEAFEGRWWRDVAVGTVGAEVLQRRGRHPGLGILVTIAGLCAVLIAWRLADGPWWLLIGTLLAVVLFVAATSSAKAVRADGPIAAWPGTARSPSVAARAATSLPATSGMLGCSASRGRSGPRSGGR